MVCWFFLIPFRSTDASTESIQSQRELLNELVGWAPDDPLASCEVDVREGLARAKWTAPSTFADLSTLDGLVFARSRSSADHQTSGTCLHRSLVELRVRLQV